VVSILPIAIGVAAADSILLLLVILSGRVYCYSSSYPQKLTGQPAAEASADYASSSRESLWQ
jgi:hypothetical protein